MNGFHVDENEEEYDYAFRTLLEILDGGTDRVRAYCILGFSLLAVYHSSWRWDGKYRGPSIHKIYPPLYEGVGKTAIQNNISYLRENGHWYYTIRGKTDYPQMFFV